MINTQHPTSILSESIQLPNGTVLKNRLIKSAMSDSLGDGQGNPTEKQARLYERWAEGGVALSIIGEVQITSKYPEKPGNLVLGLESDVEKLRLLTQRATINGAHIWPQLGHAGALSHLPLSSPKGPSQLNIPDLKCSGMTIIEIDELPAQYVAAALKAKSVGFTGIQIHAGHGFLLSQFLSPLFNHRDDQYGGSIENRSRIIVEIIDKVRKAVGASFPIGIKINSSDLLQGGLSKADSLAVIQILDRTSIDLIEISGGTYFPNAKSSSDSAISGPYFTAFSARAKEITNIPIITTGGFKSYEEVLNTLSSHSADLVGLARAFVLVPDLANQWLNQNNYKLTFPRFESPPSGAITAWYTMRINALANDSEQSFNLDLLEALNNYEERDLSRNPLWIEKFTHNNGAIDT